MNKKINIFRHAFSCSNEKHYIASKEEFYKSLRYADPSLTIWGIDTANQYYYLLTKKSYLVFVSCLIRTWLTAILLFMPRSKFCYFSIVISPYLKESSLSHGLGNLFNGSEIPIKFSDQITMLKDFIKVCYQLNIKWNGILNIKFFGSKINYKFFIREGDITLMNSKIPLVAPYDKYALNLSRSYNSLVTKEMINDYSDRLKYDNPIDGNLREYGSDLVKDLKKDKIEQMDGESYIGSDISKFINLLDVFYPSLKDVYVVAHNNIMKRFLNEIDFRIPEKYKYIIHQNIWSIEMLYNNNNNNVVKIKSGFSKPNIDSIVPECDNLCNFKSKMEAKEANVCKNKLS